MTDAARRPLTVEDCLGLKLVQDARISPDGEQVVFRVADQWKQGTPHPRSQLWLVSTAGGAARPFASGPRSDTDPRWSPDGRQVAFLSDRGEDATTQVWLVPSEGGEPRQLTHLEGEVEVPAWSHGGRRISFLHTDPLREGTATAWEWSPEGRRLRPQLVGEPRDADYDDVQVVGSAPVYRRVWSVEVASGEARPETPERLQVHDFAWSPDDTTLALIATRDHTPSGWYRAQLMTVAAGADQAKLVYGQPISQSLGQLAWSPDGRSILFTQSTMSDQPIMCGDVYSIPAGGGQPRGLTPGLKSSVTWLSWPEVSAGPLSVARKGTGTAIGRIAADGTVEELWGDYATIGSTWLPSISLADDGVTYATTRADPGHPFDVWVGRLDGTMRQLTRMNPQLDQVEVGRMESITWSGADGLEIQGQLVYPVGYQPGRRYPLVVEIHGGPGWSWLPSYYANWHDWVQVLAANGYAVLLPNPRGSTGFGTDYAAGNVRDLFGQDYQDIVRGADRVIELGVADADRQGLGGWSYGGFMTSWIITQTTRFKAAVNGAGLTNWESYYGQNHIQDWQVVFFQTRPIDDPAEHRARSPYTHFKQVRTPTLVLHGEVDHDVPVAQAYEFWRVLTDLGVEVEFALYPREAHPILEKQHQRDLLQRVVRWYDRHLK